MRNTQIALLALALTAIATACGAPMQGWAATLEASKAAYKTACGGDATTLDLVLAETAKQHPELAERLDAARLAHVQGCARMHESINTAILVYTTLNEELK